METHPAPLPKLLAGINLLMAAGVVVFAANFARYHLLLPTLPLLLLALWLLVLSRWIWHEDHRAAAAVWITQCTFLAIGLCNIVFGWFTNQAAEHSAALGGGIMGGFGLVLILIGIALTIPSAASLLLVRHVHFH